MFLFKTFLLFFVTAFFELVGCYLPWLILKQNKSFFLIIPSIISLSIFAYLLTLHPTASGKTYAAYGGVYIFMALLWLLFVDKIPLSKYDIAGIILSLLGMFFIMFQPN